MTSHGDGPLKVLAHAHAQLQLPLQPQLLGHQIPLLPQQDKVVVLILGRGCHAASNGTNGHQTQQVQVGAVLDDGPAQRRRLGAGCASRLGLLAGCVDLDVDVDLGGRGVGLDQLASVLVQQLRLFERVDARDTPEVGDLGQIFAVAWFS